MVKGKEYFKGIFRQEIDNESGAELIIEIFEETTVANLAFLHVTHNGKYPNDFRDVEIEITFPPDEDEPGRVAVVWDDRGENDNVTLLSDNPKVITWKVPHLSRWFTRELRFPSSWITNETESESVLHDPSEITWDIKTRVPQGSGYDV